MDPSTLAMMMQMFQGGGQGSGQGGGGSGMLQNFGSGLTSFLGGMFGDSGSPYRDAMKQYQKYYGEAKNAQNPFFNAGTGALGNYQDWLSKMKDPSQFINKTMEGYQESPYNKFLQDSSMRAGTNAASAGGMIGSTPFAQQMQQNAGNIASSGQQDWLRNVLGVNQQYGEGQHNLVQGGQHAGDMLSQLAMMMGGQMGEGAFGNRFGREQDKWNMISGGGKALFPWAF